MKNNISKNKGNTIFKNVIVGFLIFSMVASAFAYLFMALQTL